MCRDGDAGTQRGNNGTNLNVSVIPRHTPLEHTLVIPTNRDQVLVAFQPPQIHDVRRMATALNGQRAFVNARIPEDLD
jgi:hypothetical protein